MENGSVLDTVKNSNAATRLKAGAGDGINSIVSLKLKDNNGDRVVVGVGKVARRGYSFFDDGKPKTAWINPGEEPAAVMDALFNRGFFELETVYEVDVPLDGQTFSLKLGQFHTKRHFGRAPVLTLDEDCEVVAASGDNGKPVYMFRKLKSAN